jgi:pimeloyl-ACP methyl ester carboxylesterase
MDNTSPTYTGLRIAHARTRDIPIDAEGTSTAVTYTDHDHAQTFLVLHGGGGPATVADFAGILGARKHARVIVPTHPGFALTSRPESLSSVKRLAKLYLDLVASLELADVTVIGNSFGGWIACEMGLANNGRISGLVLVDAVGPVVPGHPITDVSKLAPHEISVLSFHRPERFAPKGPPAEGAARPSPNIAALVAYTGRDMCDPTLLERLKDLDLPVHVIWGESDRIVTPAYGRAIADSVRGATFTLLRASGHLPQFETPEELLGAICGEHSR